MEEIAVKKVDVRPYFDLEDFMNFSRETRLENAVLQAFAELWGEWSGKLNVCQVKSGKNSWLAVWLPEQIEQYVDAAWQEQPSKGFLLNCLAQYLCMLAVQELLPQTIDGGCAPAPVSTPQLVQAMQKAGLEYMENSNQPLRRYVIVTFYPFKGGCEVCNLKDNCPKAKGMGDFASVLLPGYERGVD